MDPRIILQKITNIVDIGLGHSTVDKILSNSCFCLKIPTKESFWSSRQKKSTSVCTKKATMEFSTIEKSGVY